MEGVVNKAVREYSKSMWKGLFFNTKHYTIVEKDEFSTDFLEVLPTFLHIY